VWVWSLPGWRCAVVSLPSNIQAFASAVTRPWAQRPCLPTWACCAALCAEMRVPPPPPPSLRLAPCLCCPLLHTGTQLDMWSCGPYGSCLAMASLLTSDARAEATAAAVAAAAARFQRAQSISDYGPAGLVVPSSVPEDHVGEDPRSGWRLVTGHENGQLLLWNAASDHLQPLVRVGDPGHSPVKALCVMEEQGLLGVVHANGDLALFLRPARDRDWLMGPTTAAAAAAAAATAAAGLNSSGGGCGGGSIHAGLGSGAGAGAASLQQQHQLTTAAAAAGASALGPEAQQSTAAAAAAERGKYAAAGSSAATAAAAAGLATIKPRRVVLRTHRSMLVAAAACSSGMVTASATGCMKLWLAEGLGKEAERCGLLTQAARDARWVGAAARRASAGACVCFWLCA
jgi:hypothetical protein